MDTILLTLFERADFSFLTDFPGVRSHESGGRTREHYLWMLGDAAFDILNWHDDLIEENTVAIAPYNERNPD